LALLEIVQTYHCGLHEEIDHQLDIQCFGTTTHPLASLLDELASKDIDIARTKLADAIQDDTLDRVMLWPHHIELAALWPEFGSRTPTMHILGLVSVAYTESGAWDSGSRDAWTERPLSHASSLYPPPEAFELLRHVSRGKLVIGWSRTLAVESPGSE
jgi:hypothetical protein